MVQIYFVQCGGGLSGLRKDRLNSIRLDGETWHVAHSQTFEVVTKWQILELMTGTCNNNPRRLGWLSE